MTGSNGDTNGTPPVAIEVRGLKKNYDEVEAVRGVEFTVATGEVFGFLGPNGAGKTTTVGVLTTRVVPTSGPSAERASGQWPASSSPWSRQRAR
jgi:ABC-2 type transport system ATP-binding protein